MEKRKLTKEDIDKVRDIEGFPIGTDEDIIALSDAPYYTACPNPFIKEFIEKNGTPYEEETDDYHCEPFAADVSEGKTDPIYMAHAYHTKVPYKAIVRYILHYTNPGDIVFDGFCGTGMTGVAAQSCGHLSNEDQALFKAEMGNVKFGTRKAVLNDLAPIAGFLADVYNSHVDPFQFEKRLDSLISQVSDEVGWVYETNVSEDNQLLFGSSKGPINYTIWSDVLICPHCGEEIVFWDAAIEGNGGKVKDVFSCPHCGASMKKNDCEKAMTPVVDDALGKVISMIKQVPVQINYTYGGKRYTKRPDKSDMAVIEKVNNMHIPYWYPTLRMPEGKEARRNDKSGITHVHHFFTKRNLYVLSCLYEHIGDDKQLKFLFTSILQRASKLFKWSKNQAGPLSGTLYISSCVYETSVFSLINNKKKLFEAWRSENKQVAVNTASLTDLRNVPNNSIDYIFTDPPFGGNLMYSELSYLWEAWLKVRTNNSDEAIIDTVQNKSLVDYQNLMTASFTQCFNILKPGHWMTVEFHNSKNSVWNAIQQSLSRAGFIIADVRTLDKKQGSFKQVNNTSAVKQDLVISAYKPKEKFRKEFESKAGTEETAWAFVRQHLANLPVVVDSDHDGKIDIIAERQAYLLFDRMVAYHIMNGIPVPIDATDFYKGLDEKFLKRDGMYFLPDQVNEYDIARIKMDVEPIQFELFVSNEKSAIAWLYQQLDTPQTYAELQPKFMQEVKSVDRYEDMPELSVMLDENFIQDDKGRWYIPDRTKEGDVAKLREKNLWKEFESYMNSKGKLKLFRSEAIRVGFSRLWKDKNYQAIVDMAERLPEQTIQEDDKLLMYYDISLSRVQ
ncbi:DNA methyltransferase [Mitsuokella multacida]|uniref:DNA methyltransferase n=1 Tax=Mitsuokella multacida TaxID=52226 RepID=UPI0022DE9A01|nr:DNA methyltransferase [Mitsuokella multacida]